MENTSATLRAPVVTVLGHVDHGKTTLLSKIRDTKMPREAGGITQSIGAWQVVSQQGKKITFIDTPGHEAFSQMRSRGAKVADIVVLVVAADDGVMPQTVESIKHIKEAGVPLVVAITKIDLPGAKIEDAKRQLVSAGVLLEGSGGDTPVVEVSAKTGEGINALLEMITLLGEIGNVSGSVDASVLGVVIETEVDRRRGLVASLVIREGVLSIGDDIEAGGIPARVRGLFDAHLQPIQKAMPGEPCQMLGFSQLPPVGSVICPAGDGMLDLKKEEKRTFPKTDKFCILLKADTAGSLEAIIGQLSQTVAFADTQVGSVSQSDVLLAASVGASIVAFNVHTARDVQRYALEEGVGIYTYTVIYELLQDVARWQLEEEERRREKVLGVATIIAEFPHGKSRIAGCRVTEGKISKRAKTRLVRDSKVLGGVYIRSLQKGKTEIDEVGTKDECGIFFEPQLDFVIGDMLESYQLPAKTDN